MRELWLAMLICAVGIGLLDVGRDLLQDLLYAVTRDSDGAVRDNFVLRLVIRIWLDGAFYAGLAALWLVALVMVFPRGIVKDEYPTLLAVLFSLVLGRSFIGVGEGLSTDFLLLNMVWGGLAFAAHSVVTGRD